MKRFVDVVVSLGAILFFSPIFLLVALVLVFTGHKVLFRQRRLGLNGEEFTILKFVTMVDHLPKEPGEGITTRDDPRVTKIGRFLRITKINELPQLANVLLGSMSIVGPRPLMRDGFDMFSQQAQSAVRSLRPGITSISSIVFRDEEKLVSESELDPLTFYKTRIFPVKSELEIWYWQNKSLRVDLLIMMLTGLKVIWPSAAFERQLFPRLPAFNP